MKTHLRLDGTSDDALLTTMITGAAEYVERATNMLVVQRQVVQYEKHKYAQTGAVYLVRWPLGTISEVKLDGVVSTDYELYDGLPPYIELDGSAAEIEITYTAGPTACPAGLKAAIILYVELWWEAPNEQIHKIEEACDRLINQWRMFA